MIIPPPDAIVSLQSLDNRKWVCAEGEGNLPLVANRQEPQTWELFRWIDMSSTFGQHSVSLLAQANGKYVCAENGGLSPLIANRDTPKSWETFTWISHSDGNISLRSIANGTQIGVDAVTDHLVANQSRLGVIIKFAIKIW